MDARSALFLAIALALSSCGIEAHTPQAEGTSTPTPPPAETATAGVTRTATAFPQGERIMVGSTEDAGPASLRTALAHAQPGDTITFDPTVFRAENPGVIRLETPLSALTTPHITVDASNAGVILDGKQLGDRFLSGLEIQSSNNTIKGLQFINFPGPGLAISGGRDNLIEANHFRQNQFGVGVWGETSGFNRFINNYVGVQPNGLTPGGNSGAGMFAWEGAHDNSFGPGNVVAFNTGAGVEIAHEGTVRNRIYENSIHDNAGTGIALSQGGNMDLAAPRLTGLDPGAGILLGVSCPVCQVLVYSDTIDQGANYKGSAMADESGMFTFNLGTMPSGSALTATSTDETGNTSAFSIPAAGGRISLLLQEGNTGTMQPLINQPSDVLDDNGMGGLWSPTRGGFFEETIENEIVPLGLKHVRLQFNEGEFITTGDGAREIDWSRQEMPMPSDMQDIVPLLTSHQITTHYVLIFWDKANHPDGWQVNSRFKTQEEIDRYLDYVRYVVTRFKGQVQYYELWNEPNVTYPLQYIQAQDYIKVAALAIPLIHEIDPAAKVIVGAVSSTANPEVRRYLFDILNSELMPMADVLSWHPFYGIIPGAGNYPDYYGDYPALLAQIMSTARDHGFRGEFMADELSYAAGGCGGCDDSASLTEADAANYTARVVILHRAQGVMAGVAGVTSSRNIHYATLQNLANVLAGAHPADFDVQVQSKLPDVKVFTFGRSDGTKLAAIWHDGPATGSDPGTPSDITLPGLGGWQATAVDVLNGFQQQLISTNSGADLRIDGFLVRDRPILILLSR